MANARKSAQVFGSQPLLGWTSYDPASLSVYSATSAWAALDATHLVVPIIVPPSGLVRVMMSALFSISGTVTSGALIGMWGADVGGGTPLGLSVISEVTNAAPGNVQPIILATAICYIVSGLTPGNSVTVRWLATYSTSSGASIASPTFKTYAGQSSAFSPLFASPAIMEVWAA